MLSLAERFQSGRLSARDAQRIIGAGLRGAGNDISDEAVGRMQADGGAAGFVDIVARLLERHFRRPSRPSSAPSAGNIASAADRRPPAPCGGARQRGDTVPFPGPT